VENYRRKVIDMVNESKKKKDRIIVEISPELMVILEKIKDYVQNISYGSMRPSTYEASKFLAERIKIKDLKYIV
jgi:hypothetical protein